MRYITKPKSPRLNYNASISNGMILAYPFGRGFPYGITNRAKDFSRQGNHGTINGNPFIKPTPWGGGLDFSSDYLRVKNSHLLSKLYNTTISIIFKADTVGDKTLYSENIDWPAPIFLVNIVSSEGNRLRCGIHEGPGDDWHFIYSNDALVVGKWYHAVYTRSNVNGMKLYLNGIEQTTYTTGSKYSPDYKGISGYTANATDYGRHEGTGYEYFDGIIDSSYCWKRALDRKKITQLYKKPFKPYVHTRILDGIAVSEETEKSILRGVLRGMNVGFS
jgi:hypothetical protein